MKKRNRRKKGFRSICLLFFVLLPGFGTGRGLAASQYNAVHQLTEEELQEMNRGEAVLVYNDEGYLTFLNGRFYDRPVSDYEEGIESLYGVASLLGLSKGSDFFCVFGETSETGYTTFTYKQRYGDLTMENATLKVVLDPEGYTAGLSCSFTPNLGLAPEVDNEITREEAENLVRSKMGGEGTVCPEYTKKTAVTVGNIAYHAWAVYTENPDEDSDRAYL